MPARKANPAKRGRKPAVPGAKLAQLTIRVPPTQRLALELLSRELGVSLSQVVERAVASAVNSWEVAGIPATQQVLRWNDRKNPKDLLRIEAIAEDVLDSEPLLITQMPRSLLREHEGLFLDTLTILLREKVFTFPANGEEAENLLELCRLGFRSGFAPEDMAEHWKDLQARAQK